MTALLGGRAPHAHPAPDRGEGVDEVVDVGVAVQGRGRDAQALLPVPPMMPPQLEKVILNSSPANISGSISSPSTVVDDTSVLPAPNHAVLNHLAASAIKNGVLAVGSVQRYKRKVRCPANQYVTTLLYRPVHP